MLLAVDFDEYFIDEEGVAITSVPTPQSPGIQCAEFDAPEPDGFTADDDTSFCQEVLDITVAEI